MQTAMQAHIEVMKNELLNMYQNDIRFGLLLKLIRHAQELIEEETERTISRHPQHIFSNPADSSYDTDHHQRG